VLLRRSFHSSPLFLRFVFSSVLFGQQEGGYGAVGLGDNPDGLVGGGAVTAQEPEPAFETELVFPAVSVGHVSPFTVNVACEEFVRLLSSLFESGQSARRGDDLAKRKKAVVLWLVALKKTPFVSWFIAFEATPESGALKANALPGGWGRLAVRAVKGAVLAFIGAKRRPLTEGADGSGAGFQQEGQRGGRIDGQIDGAEVTCVEGATNTKLDSSGLW